MISDPDYARVFTKARCIAWSEGYAMTLHGTATRDLDLLACPWNDQACEADHLMNRVADACELNVVAPLTEKPHGRLSCTMMFKTFGDPRFIDLSIMPRKMKGGDA